MTPAQRFDHALANYGALSTYLKQHALFSCHNDACASELTYHADDLRLLPTEADLTPHDGECPLVCYECWAEEYHEFMPANLTDEEKEAWVEAHSWHKLAVFDPFTQMAELVGAMLQAKIEETRNDS